MDYWSDFFRWEYLVGREIFRKHTLSNYLTANLVYMKYCLNLILIHCHCNEDPNAQDLQQNTHLSASAEPAQCLSSLALSGWASTQVARRWVISNKRSRYTPLRNWKNLVIEKRRKKTLFCRTNPISPYENHWKTKRCINYWILSFKYSVPKWDDQQIWRTGNGFNHRLSILHHEPLQASIPFYWPSLTPCSEHVVLNTFEQQVST